jgi:succinate dehydrogenase / fumarate reductase cytochrome b subunit
MSININQPSAGKLLKWFDPRWRQMGSWAFILNRITALGLTFYLFLHLFILRQLAQGPDAYDRFLETIHNPLFISGELLVVIAGLYHGLNGLRISLTSFGIGVPQQKRIFLTLLAITVIASLVFAIRMYTA